MRAGSAAGPCGADEGGAQMSLPLFERSALLRTLNYLRVRHQFYFRYNILYPMICAAVTLLALKALSPEPFFSANGIASRFSTFFAITTPFYIAALAAISTFPGPKFFDEPFKMSRPTTIVIAGDLGAPETVEVTQRHFLCLLYGYCCILSFLLFLVAVVAPVVAPGLSAIFGATSQLGSYILSFIFLFFVFQSFILLLLGIYFLSDRIHRKDME